MSFGVVQAIQIAMGQGVFRYNEFSNNVITIWINPSKSRNFAE